MSSLNMTTIPEFLIRRLKQLGVGLLCNSEDELYAALSRATQTEEFFIIRARVPKGQYSPGLIRLTSALKKRI